MQTNLWLSFMLAFLSRSSAIRSFVIGCLVVVWPQVFHSELVKPGGSGTLFSSLFFTPSIILYISTICMWFFTIVWPQVFHSELDGSSPSYSEFSSPVHCSVSELRWNQFTFETVSEIHWETCACIRSRLPSSIGQDANFMSIINWSLYNNYIVHSQPATLPICLQEIKELA